jgi:hypothetical protein
MNSVMIEFTSPCTRRAAASTILGALCGWSAARGQAIPTNYDESKVGKYTLPDPLLLENGERVRDPQTWNQRRRPEIFRLFEENVYGRTPHGGTKEVRFEPFDLDKNALGGKAIRKQITMSFSHKKDGPKADLLVYLPTAARKPVPIFLGLNFRGNHTIVADPGIRLPEVWDIKTKTKQRATEDSRGATEHRWQVRKILDHGYGLAVIYYGEIEPDFVGGLEYGIRPLFFKAGQTQPAPDDWGAIGAWSWATSRALDYLETDKGVDAKRVAVMGHSRLGKTALWTGAQDTRFAMVIANCPGEGGASLSRRNYGETIRNLTDHFPHWFCANYKKYAGHADRLPVDAHELIALSAPRPLYVTAAEDDRWADPRGEFLAEVAASPVYELLGKQGIGTQTMPGLHQPIMHTLGFHIRAGKHDVTAYDWDQFLKFADLRLRT